MLNYPCRKYHQENGSTLVITLMITMLMMVMAMALIGYAYFTSEQAYFYHDYSQALYTAEAGLNQLVVSGSTSAAFYITDTVGSNNARFYTYSYPTTIGTISYVYAVSTGEVTRVRSVHRIIQVQIIPGDSPWNHMLYVGGNTVPAGSDPSAYPPGYNSTTNGPMYNKQYIPRYILDTSGNWIPYYDLSTSAGNLYLSPATTIGIPTGLTKSWAGNGCNMYGAYSGILYLNGTLNIPANQHLYIYGSLVVVGGNINILNNASLTVVRNLSHMDYATLACIDTNAPDDFSTWTPDVNAGNINQGTGNATLTVRPPIGTPAPTGGGAIYCSNIYAKNGQGTNINGVIVGMGTNINGFPSGNYLFDPTVAQNPPLGFDLSKCMTKRQIASRSWREIPYSF
jgi:hypothetical protein